LLVFKSRAFCSAFFIIFEKKSENTSNNLNV
jgi:hypothetical protein